MEKFIRQYCKFCNYSFDEIIQQYNSNIKKNDQNYINLIIDYKIKNNKDVIYKEDILKMLNLSQEEFMEKVMKDAKGYKLDINDLKFKYYTWYLWFYFISTFLENEPVDIKIALKD